MNNFNIHNRRAGDVVKESNRILQDNELSDNDKMRQLLNLEFLRVGIGGGVGGI